MQSKFVMTQEELNKAISAHVQKTYGFKGVSVTGIEQAVDGSGVTVVADVAVKQPITRKAPAKKGGKKAVNE